MNILAKLCLLLPSLIFCTVDQYSVSYFAHPDTASPPNSTSITDGQLASTSIISSQYTSTSITRAQVPSTFITSRRHTPTFTPSSQHTSTLITSRHRTLNSLTRRQPPTRTPTPEPDTHVPGWCGLHITQTTGVCYEQLLRCRTNHVAILVYDAAQREMQGWATDWKGNRLVHSYVPIKGTTKELFIEIDSPPMTSQATHNMTLAYGDERWEIKGMAGANLPYGAHWHKGDRCKVGMYDPGDGARMTWVRQLDCGFNC